MAPRVEKDARYYEKNRLRQHIYQQLVRLEQPHRLPVYGGIKYRSEAFQRRCYEQLVSLCDDAIHFKCLIYQQLCYMARRDCNDARR